MANVRDTDVAGWHPFGVSSGVDNSATATGADRAEIIGNPHMSGSRTTAEKLNEWFNTAAFTYNTPGTFGNSARNFLCAPGLSNFDFSMIKFIPIPLGPAKETQRLQFRAEFFNLFNHPNFGGPDSSVVDGSFFGQIHSAGSPRIVQLALKFVF